MIGSSVRSIVVLAVLLVCGDILPNPAHAQLAVTGDVVHTMAGPPISSGVVLIRGGKIAAVGPASEVRIPDDFKVIHGAVVTPGLIDAHSVVGLAGIYNVDHDQDQLESSTPVQPQLRAIDAYNASEALISHIRGYGVTAIHTGHAPGELVSGQMFIVKTIGSTVDEALVMPATALAVTLSSAELKSGGKSPGTRGKSVAMLRQEFIRAREYQREVEAADRDPKANRPDRDLKLESLARALSGELAVLVTAERSQDILSALRIADEFSLKLWLDSASEAYLVADQIAEAGVPVIVHPTMARAVGQRENLSFENAARLKHAGVQIALQSGFEPYVPKTRVVLFEAGMAAANGLNFDEALATVTRDAAAILGVADRMGSLQTALDADIAIFDGDPFEYTTHCTGVIINGQIVSSDSN